MDTENRFAAVRGDADIHDACSRARAALSSASPRLIALYSSDVGMGKSEVARFLVEQGYTLVKFADTIKAMTRVFLLAHGIPAEEIERYIEGDRKEADLGDYGLPGFSSRRIQQLIGTEWGRTMLGLRVWVNLAVDKVQTHLSAGRRVVVDDLREPHEYAALAAQGARFVRVHAASPRRRMGELEAAHSSNGALEGFVFRDHLVNDGTTQDLRRAALALLR